MAAELYATMAGAQSGYSGCGLSCLPKQFKPEVCGEAFLGRGGGQPVISSPGIVWVSLFKVRFAVVDGLR